MRHTITIFLHGFSNHSSYNMITENEFFNTCNCNDYISIKSPQNWLPNISGFYLSFSVAPNQWSKECSTEQLHDIHPQSLNKKEPLCSI